MYVSNYLRIQQTSLLPGSLFHSSYILKKHDEGVLQIRVVCAKLYMYVSIVSTARIFWLLLFIVSRLSMLLLYRDYLANWDTKLDRYRKLTRKTSDRGSHLKVVTLFMNVETGTASVVLGVCSEINDKMYSIFAMEVSIWCNIRIYQYDTSICTTRLHTSFLPMIRIRKLKVCKHLSYTS